jgi:alanine racemase
MDRCGWLVSECLNQSLTSPAARTDDSGVLNRRQFLAASAALGARPLRPGSEPGRSGVRPGSDRGLTPVRPPVQSGIRVDAEPTSQFDPWVEIHAQNLRHNVGEIARVAGGRPILAVIKNNGYGLGVVNVGRLLDDDQRIAGFAVVKLHEAITLRDAGVKKPILLMGPFTDGELTDLAARDVMPMVYRDHGTACDAAAAKTGRPVTMHLKIDTGMGRVGVAHDKAASLIKTLAARKSIRIDGIMTALSEDEAFDREQVGRLVTLADTLGRDGLRLGKRHAASSFALFQNRDAFLDMVRPGMAIFGVYSEAPFRTMGTMQLRPAMALRTRVVLVKQLHPGESAGYNRAFMAKVPTWVATLPVGHTDGWPRVAAKGAKVRIGSNLYPVVASVSASHTIVDLGQQTTVATGDVATLFDWTEGSRPEDVSQACGASVYDLTMHLNPLLPRKLLR